VNIPHLWHNIISNETVPDQNLENGIVIFLISRNSPTLLVFLDHNDSHSVISIFTHSKETDDERVWKIFLICWFLHFLIGLLALIWDYHSENYNAYLYVAVMTFKWLEIALIVMVVTLVVY
jgi:hypothetical protein